MKRWSFRWAAARSRVECARCLESIAAGETRLESAERYRGIGGSFVHPECALDVDTLSFVEWLSQDPTDFSSRDELEALAQVRARAILRRRDARWSFLRAGIGANERVAAVEPSVSFEDERASVSPARDRQGRPRVRIVLLGGALSTQPSLALRDGRLREGDAWVSAKREYVFVRSFPWRFELDEDPAQPFVGLVYALNARSDAREDRSGALWEMSALGFSRPVLWLLGLKGLSKHDANIVRARQHVQRNGYDADDCPVVCARSLDARAMDSLVLALDEHCDGSEYRFREAPAAAASRALLRAVKEQREFEQDGFEAALAAAKWGETSESRATLARVAESLIAQRDPRRAAMVLASNAEVSRAVYEQWFELERAETSAVPTFSTQAAVQAFDLRFKGEAMRELLAIARDAVSLERWSAFVGLLPLFVAPDWRALLSRAIDDESSPERRSKLTLIRARLEEQRW